MSFSTSYSDTGLWGIYLVSENLGNLDNLMHFTLCEWTRMSIAPTIVEVERAKSQLKASLLLRLDGTTAIAEDIGRQLVTSGQRMTPRQIKNAIDVVNPNEIKRVAQKYLWDKDVHLLLSFIPPILVVQTSSLLPHLLPLTLPLGWTTLLLMPFTAPCCIHLSRWPRLSPVPPHRSVRHALNSSYVIYSASELLARLLYMPISLSPSGFPHFEPCRSYG